MKFKKIIFKYRCEYLTEYEDCSKVFREKEYYIEHFIKKHTNHTKCSKIYTCLICFLKIKTKYNFEKHILEKHNHYHKNKKYLYIQL